MQGELFLPGALKEFDDKGLSNFLFVAPKVTPKAVAKVVAKPTPKPTPRPTPKPTPRPTPKPTPRPTPRPTPKPTPRPSQFELAYKKMLVSRKGIAKVNMKLMEKDFIFSRKMIRALHEPLKSYQTRDALEDMKTFDKLGTKTEPVSLYFLKYLIDKAQHQGLFNITSVLGSRFWLKNDIDKINRPVYVELRNDKTTGHKWQIIVLSDALAQEVIKPIKRKSKKKSRKKKYNKKK